MLYDKISVVVFWTYAKRLFNRLLDSSYIFVGENTNLKKKAHWSQNFSHEVQYILTTMHLWAQGFFTKAISVHRAFLLRPSMEPGFSCQIFITGFAKNRAGIQSCVVVSYHWGGKPGMSNQNTAHAIRMLQFGLKTYGIFNGLKFSNCLALPLGE